MGKQGKLCMCTLWPVPQNRPAIFSFFGIMTQTCCSVVFSTSFYLREHVDLHSTCQINNDVKENEENMRTEEDPFFVVGDGEHQHYRSE